MQIKLVYLFICFILPSYLEAQNINGFIYDNITGESIEGAVLTAGNYWAESKNQGNFSLPFKLGSSIDVNIGAFGYLDTSFILLPIVDKIYKFYLTPTNVLPELKITATKETNHYLEGKYLSKFVDILPIIGGEKDINKVLLQLPGISPAEEGDSKLNIRGSDDYQNAYYLDGIRIFNPNHLGGYLSSFNTDVIKDFKLIKGGFEPEHGGFSSSMIEVKTLDGDTSKIMSKIHFGLLTAAVGLNGPIWKNKLTFNFASRISIWGELLKLNSLGFEKRKKDNTYYYTMNDINAKLQYRLSDRSRVSISFYNSRDHHSSNDRYRISSNSAIENTEIDEKKWVNNGVGLNYFTKFKNTFLTISSSYSGYRFEGKTEQLFIIPMIDSSNIRYNSLARIQEIQSKISVSRIISNHDVSIGVQNTFSKSLPSIYYKQSLTDSSKYFNTLSFYLNDQIRFTHNLKMNVGARFNILFNTKNFVNFEPRFKLNYDIKEKVAIFTSYAKVSQYYQKLLSSNLLALSDIWVSVADNMPPEVTDIIELGMSYQRGKIKHFSVTLFYKSMKGLSLYKSFSENEPFLNPNWKNNVFRNGSGWAAGIEGMVILDIGRFHINSSLTYSRSYRRFQSLNDGLYFPYDYDRPVIFNSFLTINLSEKWNFGGQFAYFSGRRVTVPNGIVLDDPYYLSFPYFVFDRINNGKLPDHHRLDVSFVKTTARKKSIRQFSIGCYNIYAKKNITSFRINVEYNYDNNGKPTAVKDINISYKRLLPILPYISYGINF